MSAIVEHMGKDTLRTAFATADAAPATSATEQVDFDTVYREQRGRVLATVRGVIGASDELEDVVQQVFIEIHRCLPRFEGRSRLSTWVYRISVNVALQHLRKKKRKRWLMLGSAGDEDVRMVGEADPTSRLEGRALLREVYRSVNKLPDKKRVVWTLHELQGLAPQQIAEVLEIPMNTVRSRLLSARNSLQQDLKRRGIVGGGRS